MIVTFSPSLTLEQFLTQHGDNPRYELIDGELRDMDPTGPHEAVAGKLAAHIGAELLRLNRPWFIPRTCLIKLFATPPTALRPDVIVLDETQLHQEPLWQTEPLITNGSSIPLVVEVVSTNWQDDYARKVEEYALLGIPEYWIVDFRGLGGVSFIGKPKQPTFTVCTLNADHYHQQQYRLGDSIFSPTFPQLSLGLDDILSS